MTDTGCDGWNGTQIAIRQNNSYYIYSLSGGKSYGPVPINLTIGVLAELIVYKLGTNSAEVGVKLLSGSGVTMMNLVPGSTLVVNKVLASFTPGMLN